MAQTFPYTFISCPCSDVSQRLLNPKRTSRDIEPNEELQEEEKTFDPRDPRSNFSLFPPEHLLYCEECHEIKCPRCVTEEIICSYCPSCLFEVPSSSVKTDYNRCARNCFSCPICTSQLITASIGDKNEGPWILSCNYCMWSSLDAGIKFNKPQNLRQQVDRMANGGKPQPDYKDETDKHEIRHALARAADRYGIARPAGLSEGAPGSEVDHDLAAGRHAELLSNPHARFQVLKSFYKDQITSSGGDAGSTSNLDYSSPSSLTRIMNLYANPGNSSYKKTKPLSTPMREAQNPAEGLLLPPSSPTKTNPPEYIDTASPEQQSFQYPHPVGNPTATSITSLRPMSTLLRTKRSKRCAACKHILVKPEFKVTSTRYRIKLVALNYIPLVTLKPVPIPNGLPPPGPDGTDIVLEPSKPSQWIMTLRNPLFENVNVTLASPSITPGKHGHKVTILCPMFSIGKNGDVWDDALTTTTASNKNPTSNSNPIVPVVGGEQIAGKIYDSGRNWTSVVIEIVPAPIILEGEKAAELDEDEDVVEIPVRVRLEWTVTDEEHDKGNRKKVLGNGGVEEEEEDDGTRELAYWMVLGLGRVAC